MAVHIKFLSTLPVRGATHAVAGDIYSRFVISIHAPREGSDLPYPAAS